MSKRRRRVPFRNPRRKSGVESERRISPVRATLCACRICTGARSPLRGLIFFRALPRASAQGFYMGSPYGTFSFLENGFQCGDVDVCAPNFCRRQKSHFTSQPVLQFSSTPRKRRYFRAVVVVSVIFVSPFAGTSTSQKTSPESFSSVKPDVVAGMRS